MPDIIRDDDKGQESVRVEKWMLEITVYPNGKVYPKMFPIGYTKKKLSDNKKSREKPKNTSLESVEEY